MTLQELILDLQELEKKYEQYSQDTALYINTHSGDDAPLEYVDSVLCQLMSKDGKYTGKKACHIVLCASLSIPEKKKKRVKKYDAPRTNS
jgi:hypothetical protein